MKNRNKKFIKVHFKQLLIATMALTLLGSCKVNKEHLEARSITFSPLDFKTLRNGEYYGYYEGGMYQWRENTCKVDIDSGRVTNIVLVNCKAGYTQQFLDTIYNRIIRKQSLHIDAYSGATLDSKACLKSVEDALINAQ